LLPNGVIIAAAHGYQNLRAMKNHSRRASAFFSSRQDLISEFVITAARLTPIGGFQGSLKDADVAEPTIVEVEEHGEPGKLNPDELVTPRI
jgi:hypothetical protein